MNIKFLIIIIVNFFRSYVHCIQREQGIICGVNVFGLVIIRINANETMIHAMRGICKKKIYRSVPVMVADGFACGGVCCEHDTMQGKKQ